MSNLIIRAIDFDEDGVCTISFLNKGEDLRKGGAVWRSSNVSVSPDARGYYQDARDILEAAEELLQDLLKLYKDEPPYLPEEEEDEEDQEERGMGW